MRNVTGARWFFGISLGLLFIVWLLILTLMDLTFGEVLDMLAATAIGTIGLVSIARAFSATTRPALALWLARGFIFFGLAIAVYMPAVFFGETRFAPDAAKAIMAEFDTTPVSIVLAAVPALVALRWPKPASILYFASAIWGGFSGAFDPFGSFPDRDVQMSIVIGLVPSLVIGLTLLYASRGDAAAGPEFRDWLRTLVGRTAAPRYATA